MGAERTCIGLEAGAEQLSERAVVQGPDALSSILDCVRTTIDRQVLDSMCPPPRSSQGGVCAVGCRRWLSSVAGCRWRLFGGLSTGWLPC
jgi:hypothetical protein